MPVVMLRRTLPLLALSILPPLAMLGCGGGGGGGSGPSTPNPTATSAPTPGATGTAEPTPNGTTSAPGATSTPVPTATPRPTATPALPPLSTPIPLIEGRRMGEDYFAAPNSTGLPIDGNSCDAAHYDYHIHSHLSIFVNGKQLAVPAAIGIKNPHFITTTEYPDGFVSYGACVYNLHTHDTSGKLHVESATPQQFTLGELFRIWVQPLTRQNVAGITGLPLVIYINDGTNLRRYDGDPRSIVLQSKREITFQFGTPLSQIPTYIWYGEEDQNHEHEAVTAARIAAMKAKK